MNEGFRPVHGVGLAAVVLVGISAVLDVLVAALAWLTVDADQFTPLGAAVSLMLSWCLLVAFVVTAATFIVWLYQARVNADRITSPHQHRYSRAWLVGGWFVPIMNLFVPHAVVQDVWRASDPANRLVPLPERPQSGLITGWWICFLLSNVTVILPASRSYELTVYTTISAALSVAAAVLAALVIRQVNDLQVNARNASPAPAA
ncbi:DUF4328 domain-containing protein [Lentzea sp. NPDC003310]|uniref:DUF4328 domain-containing protein n=1 Tax=Lentzea sp. NPDC003310 TaxID=3154447 RepID=UPI0033A0A2E8